MGYLGLVRLLFLTNSKIMEVFTLFSVLYYLPYIAHLVKVSEFIIPSSLKISIN